MKSRRKFYAGPRCEYPKNGGFCDLPATKARPGSGRTGNCFWFCSDHAEKFDAEQKEREKASNAPPELDRGELRRILLHLRVSCDDADTVVRDMLRVPRKRELGPALHRQSYREARDKIVTALDYLLRLVRDDGDTGPADPAGNGGAGPVH
jgi:hypothetical protein